MNTHSQPSWRVVLDYLICYLLWAVLAAGAFWLIFSLRVNLMDLAVWARINPWFPRAVDKWGTFVLGIAWIAWVLILEGHLRKSVETRRFWPSFLRAASVLIIIAAISYALQLPFR